MGLTIHYKLSTEEDWPSEKVREWLEIMADYARHIGCASVGPVVPSYEEMEVTKRLHKAGRGYSTRYVDIHAEEGWVLIIDVGAGCQLLALGMFKYPRQWRCQQGSSSHRWYPTKITPEWQFDWFCKTQFAGKHGPAHFIRCHKSVISLLDFCRKAGLKVTVRDEAGYWEKRDEAELTETLRRSEAMLATLGGLLRNATDKPDGPIINSPIFEYANFEHLEHEDWERYGKVFVPLKKCLRRQ
jgi:hypothetical protein